MEIIQRPRVFRSPTHACDFASASGWNPPVPHNISFQAPEAVHLLSRLQFGVREDEVERAVSEGLDDTLERLLSIQPETDTFQQSEAALRATAYATSDINDLKAWWHYATSYAKVHSVPMMAAQNDRFRELAWGSFRELLHAEARDPAMLVWLDGNANRKRHPNENFAREVMELFSLGIGNYTEHDIQEAARAFSGWHLRDKAFWFNATQHDATEKTIFGKTGRYQGDDVLNLCLDHAACPRFLAFKLLRTFVTSAPTAEQIEHVAGRYRKADLQTGPVLRDICRSAEFFAPEHRRNLIKSPLDFILGTLRPLASHIHWQPVRELLARMGQDVFEPPSVKGWDGGRQWIQSTGWILRWNFVSELVTGDRVATLRPEVWSTPDPWLPGWEL
ncbi:MAG: hypothetical protein B7Z55_04945, partial [Planctomycetales bacterium 12-60-4]